MKIPKFKIRCSAIFKIMADDVKTKPLTENQKKRLAELLKKEKLTENQHNEMN